MARSLRVSKVGRRQTYSSYLDPEEIHYAQKAINQRITDIANKFGVDSQIYRDYIAPLQNDVGAQFVRLDKHGLTKLRTGKDTWETEDARAIVSKMLSKATKGEILERTAEAMGKARSLEQKKRIKRKTGKDVEIITEAEILEVVDSVYDMEMKIYSRLQEIYEEAEERGVNPRTTTRLKRFKWYKDLTQAHGKPSKELIEKAYNQMQEFDNARYLNIKKEGIKNAKF